MFYSISVVLSMEPGSCACQDSGPPLSYTHLRTRPLVTRAPQGCILSCSAHRSGLVSPGPQALVWQNQGCLSCSPGWAAHGHMARPSPAGLEGGAACYPWAGLLGQGVRSWERPWLTAGRTGTWLEGHRRYSCQLLGSGFPSRAHSLASSEESRLSVPRLAQGSRVVKSTALGAERVATSRSTGRQCGEGRWKPAVASGCLVATANHKGGTDASQMLGKRW